MRVAVLTLTRDRLDFTKHCFRLLRELAGCDFDHYVLDQGSQDGTQEWLGENLSDFETVLLGTENVGISQGMNRLLELIGDPSRYDVIVKFDNDCELTVDDTLSSVCDVVACGFNWLASPLIQGLNDPPNIGEPINVLGYRVSLVSPNIGGIFLAAPGELYTHFRYADTNPKWGLDDTQICAYWNSLGNRIGYLLDFPANHYLTTEGQKRQLPSYYERKLKEFVR